MTSYQNLVISGMAVFLFSAGAVAQSRQNADDLPSDTRLLQRIDASQQEMRQGETLDEYLRWLSKNTKVDHQVNVPFDQDPIVVLNSSMSLGRLHRALASTYHLTWRTANGITPSYTLQMSRSDKQARANVRSGAALRARQIMNARLDHVRQLAFLPKDRLQQAASNGDKHAGSFLHPRTGAMAKLVFQLPASMWQQLQQGKAPVISVASLSPDLQDLAKQAAGTTRVTTSNGENYRTCDLVVPQGRIRLQMGGTLDRPTIWGSMRYGSHGNDFNVLYFEGGVRQPPEDRRKQAAALRSKRPSATAFQQKVTLRDVPRQGYYEPGERPKGGRPLLEYLRQLAAQTDLPIVADCDYKSKEQDRDSMWLRQQWWLASDIVDRPLAEALDLLCADFEYEWQFQDGVLLLWQKRWYQERSDRAYVYAPKRIPEGPK